MKASVCAKCGSLRLRRARMRSGWQQFLRRYTRLRRCVCGDCQHCGWTLGPLPHSDHPDEVRQGSPQAPSESAPRNHSGRRRHARLPVSFLLALLAGALFAALIGLTT